MSRPNYNLIKFIRRNIYMLKREYGGRISIYTLGVVSTNYTSGVKSGAHTSYDINRAIVLPNKVKREAVQSISMISANKKLVQGGTYDTGTRTFIIDRRDMPSGVTLNNDDWIVYNHKRYDIKTIDEFEQSTAWLIVAKEVEGATPYEDFNTPSNTLIVFTDNASGTTS